MANKQTKRRAANPYERFVDVGAAFNKGLMAAAEAGINATVNPIGAVKNDYERRLQTYLNKLPEGTDLTAIPDRYRGQIQDFLIKQKQNYVQIARDLDDYEVGSDEYLLMQQEMNNIKNSFVNLDAQFKKYGENKGKIIEDIESNATSLYGENQANVNLLRSMYNEELDLSIDDQGRINFSGDDGTILYDDAPGYELKSYKAAEAIVKMSERAYTRGIDMQPGDPVYNSSKNAISIGIDQGGKNTLMSLIHDGLIGNKKLIDDPYVAENVKAYYNNELSFEGLKNLVVDQYMGVISDMSKQGFKAKEKQSKRGSRGYSGGYRSQKGKYKTPETYFSKKYNQRVTAWIPYDLNDETIIKDMNGNILSEPGSVTPGYRPGVSKYEPTYTPQTQYNKTTSSNTSGKKTMTEAEIKAEAKKHGVSEEFVRNMQGK